MILSPLLLVLILFIVIGLIFILSIVMPKIAKWRGIDLPIQNAKPVLIGLAPAYALYMVFFFIIGSLLAILIYTITDLPVFSNLGMILTVFSVAWIAGFVTPGAPAGIGIREALIVLSMTHFIGDAQSLIVALIFRLISIMGDIIFFLSTSIFFQRCKLK